MSKNIDKIRKHIFSGDNISPLEQDAWIIYFVVRQNKMVLCLFWKDTSSKQDSAWMAI